MNASPNAWIHRIWKPSTIWKCKSFFPKAIVSTPPISKTWFVVPKHLSSIVILLAQFHELHANGTNIDDHLLTLMEKLQCEQDRDYVSSTSNSIEKHLLTIKNLIKKVIDNKDVFEGRFRKLQTLLIASRGESVLLFNLHILPSFV